MRKDKLQRLDAKGWKVGSTQEFLGLSDAEAAYIDLKLRLARAAKMESGDSEITVDVLIWSLLTAGASVDDLARIVAGGSSAKSAGGITST